MEILDQLKSGVPKRELCNTWAHMNAELVYLCQARAQIFLM